MKKCVNNQAESAGFVENSKFNRYTARSHVDAASKRICNFLRFSETEFLADSAKLLTGTMFDPFIVIFKIKNGKSFFEVENVVDGKRVKVIFNGDGYECTDGFTALFVTCAELISRWDSIKQEVTDVIQCELKDTEESLAKYQHLYSVFQNFTEIKFGGNNEVKN